MIICVSELFLIHLSLFVEGTKSPLKMEPWGEFPSNMKGRPVSVTGVDA